MASTPPPVQVPAPDPEDEEKGGAEGTESWRVALDHAAKGYIGESGAQKYEDDELYTMDSWVSPLWMLTQEPDLNRMVVYLQEMRARINKEPDKEHVIRFSNKEIEMARAGFSRMVRRGEMRLHRLCELTGGEMFTSSYSRQSVVVGQRPGGDGRTWQRFQLVQALSGEELYAQTDLDLGSRQLERFMWQDQGQQPQVWQKAALVANFVEYEALKVNWWGVYKCISRIKAEEEIWNKVVDEIFELDDIIKRDKQLRHLSRYVKDVFGMKMVVGNEDQARRVQKHLEQLSFSDSALLSHGVPVSDATRSLTFVEVKDYLTERDKGAKTSGWRALKSVVNWWDTTIEIQIQVLRNYHRERERITKESHSEFKARRDELRDLIAHAKPLFRFYRDLLQWLFQTACSERSPSSSSSSSSTSERFGPPPTFKNVRVELVD